MAKYHQVPTTDDREDPDVLSNGQKLWSGQDYSSIFSYSRPEQFKSYYTYNAPLKSTEMVYRSMPAETKDESTTVKNMLAETFLIGVCYAAVVLTFPFSLFLSVKFISQFERLIVFRLGRVQKAKGPGAAFVLPCIDNCRTVDMRIKAFNVPPVQAVSQDKGVVELGAVVYFRVKDALACVSSVQDFNKVIRTLGHTNLHKIVNKKLMEELERKRKDLEEDFKAQLNSSTVSWGMEVTRVEFSGVKVLKQPEPATHGVIRTLCQPQVAAALWKTLTQGGVSFVAPPLQETSQNDVLLKFAETPSDEKISFDLARFVQKIDSVCTESIAKEIGSCYQISCDEVGEFYLDFRSKNSMIDEDNGEISVEILQQPAPRKYAGLGPLPKNRSPADVYAKIRAADLPDLISGRLDPSYAYFSGKITLTGDALAAKKLKMLAHHLKKADVHV